MEINTKSSGILQTVAIFGMTGNCRNTNLLPSAVPHCKRLCLESLVSCSVIDVGIIAEFRINYGTVQERIRLRRFAFGKIWTQSGLNRQETAMTFFFQIMPVHHDSVPIHKTPSRHRADNTGPCYDFDPMQQNLSGHSHDCNPTRQNRLSFPNVTGRT